MGNYGHFEKKGAGSNLRALFHIKRSFGHFLFIAIVSIYGHFFILNAVLGTFYGTLVAHGTNSTRRAISAKTNSINTGRRTKWFIWELKNSINRLILNNLELVRCSRFAIPKIR